MDRAIPCGSKLCARREEQRRHEMHRERLRDVRKLIDTSEPRAASMDHVRINLKKEQMLEERYSDIDRDNHILLKKMSHIHGPQGPNVPLPHVQEKRPPGPTSLNRDARKKELLRITKDNQSILRRIQQAQPVYNTVEFEGAHKKATAYLKNSAEYPLVLRTPRSARGHPVSSVLLPLPEAPGQPHSARASQAQPPRQPPRQQQPTQLAQQLLQEDQGQQRAEESNRHVLKENRRLGNAYFIIEMVLDTSGGLYISAFDSEAQEQLEISLKEKAHRRLFRETNGDYSAIAARLSVAELSPTDRRLVLLDDAASQQQQQSSAAQPRSEELDADSMVARATSAG